jgi:hypothetical protein
VAYFILLNTMSSRPEDEDECKEVQHTSLHSQPFYKKEDTADNVNEESAEASNVNSNYPPEMNPSGQPSVWRGITGMISNTVSKVFGATGTRTGSESESDAEPESQEELKIKRARHRAARAYALGLSTQNVASAREIDVLLDAPLPEPKPKRQDFASFKKEAVKVKIAEPQSEMEKHRAARAFALSGAAAAVAATALKQNTAAKAYNTARRERERDFRIMPEGADPGINKSHPEIAWPPPTRLLNLKLDNFAKKQRGKPVASVPKPEQAHARAPAGKAGTIAPKSVTIDLTGDDPVLKRPASSTAVAQHKKRVLAAQEKSASRSILTVTGAYKETNAKSTVLVNSGPPAKSSSRPDPAPIFPTTLKTQVMSAASTVARSLNIGPWPSPFLSLEPAAESSENNSSSVLHSQHMGVVAASIQQFAHDVVLRSMEIEVPDKANESKAFLGTMLILREVLTQNGEGIFGSLGPLLVADSTDSSLGHEQDQETTVLSYQVLATSVILAGLDAFQGPWSEKLATDFLCMVDGYDNDSDEVAEYMIAVDQDTAVTLSSGREMCPEERLAWQLSTNLHRDDHPVIQRKRGIENADGSWKARKIEIAKPNACHISILEEGWRE